MRAVHLVFVNLKIVAGCFGRNTEFFIAPSNTGYWPLVLREQFPRLPPFKPNYRVKPVSLQPALSDIVLLQCP